MKASEYEKMLQEASQATRTLNAPVAPRLQAAEPQPATVPQPLGGDGDKAGRAGRARLRLTVYRRRLLDPDNAVGGCKFLVDALRYANLIRDDDPESLDLEVAQVKVKSKDNEGTLIEID